MLDIWDTQGYEDAIINAVLVIPEYQKSIFNGLKPAHFRPGVNRRAFAVLQGTYNQQDSKPVSNQIMISEICSILKDENKDWKYWANQLSFETPLPTNLNYYVKKLIGLYNKRCLVAASQEVQQRAESGETDIEIESFVKDTLENLDSTGGDSGLTTGFELIADVNTCLDEGDQKALCGISTGFVKLDEQILGLSRGDLIVLAGRPSMGKTTLAMNISVNAAKQNYNGLVFSIEMAQYRLGLRLLSSLTRINLKSLRRCDCDIRDRNTIPDYVNNLLFEFSTGLTCYDIESIINKAFENHRIDFIMVDYLQKLKFPGKLRHDLEVGNATTLFKNIAKEKDVPFLLLSQLSRSNEKDGKTVRRPRSSDLRDSGMIENDADIILFIHRNDIYEETENNLADIDIAKNRDGDTGIFQLYFNKYINKFENLDKTHE